MSVIIGSMRYEANAFCPNAADLDFFKEGYLLYGDEIKKELEGSRSGEDAFFDVLKKNGIKAAPTIATCAVSSGGIAKEEAFSHFKEEFVQRTTQIMESDTVEGVLLDMHGAMVTEECDDPEGVIAELIRNIVGDSVPIGVSLDAHAKITPRLVKNVDIIVGFHTIPHIDHYETSERVAELVVETIKGKIKPQMAAIAIPTLMPVEAENHEFGFYREMLEISGKYEDEDDVYSVTCFLGQPWLDCPGNAGSFITAISDSMEKSEIIVREFAETYWDKKETCVAEKYPIEETVEIALKEKGPVVITELGDAPPAGSIGDGNDLLKALLKAKPDKQCLVTVVDPQAVKDAQAAGEGNMVKTSVGWRLDNRWGEPVEIEGKVILIKQGDYFTSVDHFPGTMGMSALIQIDQIYLIVCECTFQHLDPGTYRCMNLEPADAHIVGVKSTEHFRAYYGELANDILMADTKGSSMSDFAEFKWEKKGHPIWPIDSFEWCAGDAEVYKSRR